MCSVSSIVLLLFLLGHYRIIKGAQKHKQAKGNWLIKKKYTKLHKMFVRLWNKTGQGHGMVLYTLQLVPSHICFTDFPYENRTKKGRVGSYIWKKGKCSKGQLLSLNSKEFVPLGAKQVGR